MKKLLYLCVILALCGVAKGSSVYCGIDIYKERFCTIEEAEQLKRIIPKYSDWFNDYIVALKQGMTDDYEAHIWLEQDDSPILSAYAVNPNDESITLVKERPGHFTSRTSRDPYNIYFSITEFKSNWPSGDYVLHVTFTDGHTQTWTTTIPDYDATTFPDTISGTLSADPATKALSLNWSTIDDGPYYYEVWASLLQSKKIYDSDNLYDGMPPSQSVMTPIPSAYEGKGSYNVGAQVTKVVTPGNFKVKFSSGTEWWLFKKPAAPIINGIDKCAVKAGSGDSKDSFNFTGLLNAIAADLIIEEGNDIVVTIEADNMPPREFRFPINDTAFKKGLYNYARTENASTSSFKLNTRNGKMSFSAKNIDLKGLSCPIFVGVVFGDYGVKLMADETVVNGGKATPLTLLMGITDSIKVSKATMKHATAPNADSLTVTGTFTIAGSYDKANDFVVKVDGEPYSIAGSQMITKGSTESCTKVTCKEGAPMTMTAKLDFAKCTFTITLAGVNLDAGEQTFGIDVFGTYISTLINDRFVGTYKLTLYGNSNLGDGFSLETEKNTGTISTSNNIDYILKAKGMPTYTLARTSDNLIELSPQPQNMPDWIQTNMCMLSDGSNRAFFVTGKDPDPQDVGIRVGAWTRSAAVTSTQLAGNWKITWIYQDNILANMLNKFITTDETLTITDLGNKQVKVEGASFFSGSTTMTLTGNKLVAGGLDSSVKYFSMVTDGYGISIAVIEVSPSDVVSARIGLAARAP